MLLGKESAQTSVNSTRSLSFYSPACRVKDQDAVFWPVNSLPVSPAHRQKPEMGAQPSDPWRPGSASFATGGSCQEATVPSWSTERVCTPPGCKLSRAGSPRLAWPQSLPGGAQRMFALRPTANLPEREACALPGHCPRLEEHREYLHSAPL